MNLKKRKKNFTNIFCLSLAMTILATTFSSTSIKSEAEKISTDLNEDSTTKNNPNKRIHKYLLEADNIEIENKENDLNLEIAYQLEKYNMTYQDALNLVINNKRYRESLKVILEKNPNITAYKLIRILQGKTTSLRENIFIGDSRTKGMLLSGAITEENSIYGVGYGYNWFTGKGEFSEKNTNASEGAINALQAKMNEKESYNIVIWLGVNDCNYIDASIYFNEFKKYATETWQKHNIYIVSVGPVKENGRIDVENTRINNFNISLKELIQKENLTNLKYIDLNLKETAITHYDPIGLHYAEEDYQSIYHLIDKAIKEEEKKEMDSLLNIFYNALNDYDRLFTAYHPNEMILKRNKN